MVWKTKKVPASDSFTNQNDLFSRVWLEGGKPQQTDCHYRCATRQHTRGLCDLALRVVDARFIWSQMQARQGEFQLAHEGSQRVS